MKKPTPENSVKAEVRKWLRMKGWFVFHILQGIGAFKGVSDFIAAKDGIVLFIECKSKKGTLSDDQKYFGRNIVEHRCHYIVARGYEDVQEYLERLAAPSAHDIADDGRLSYRCED